MTEFNPKTHDTDVGSHGGQSRQMMEVFENQEFGSIRVLQEAGKTFFCASDVAKALGYVNPYAAVKRHCRGPLTKREGVVQKVNQYGDAGEQVDEIQTTIFEEWCSFLNFFDSSIRFELSFMNMATDASNF
jgi:toxin-antitoxin system, toxin component, bro family